VTDGAVSETATAEQPVSKPSSIAEALGVETPAPEATPEIEYTDFSLPEGIAMDDGYITSLKDFGKESKLPQEALQKLVDLRVEGDKALLKSWDEAKTEAMKAEAQAWKEEVQKDPDVGGAKLPATVAGIDKLFAKVDPSGELKDAMMESGAMLRLPFIKFLSAISQQFADDSIDGTTTTTVAAEKKTYMGLEL